jgi:multidrug resistance protein
VETLKSGSTIASSIYTPAINDIIQTFHVSSTVAILPYSLYVLGLAFGPMIGSPCSEYFGRRAVYLVSIPIFALFTLGSGFSNDITSLSICRFFAGLFGSPGLSIGSATISDIWPPAERAIPMTAYIATPFLAPSLGPLLGGYAIMGTGNWKWTMWITLFFTATTLLPACLFMKETYKMKILSRRQHSSGERRVELKSWFTTTKIAREAPSFVRHTLMRPVRMLFEPIAGLYALYVAFNFGVVYIFFAVFPSIFEETYGFNLGEQGLAFLGLGVGTLLAVVAIIYWSLRIYKPKVMQWKKEATTSHAESEKRTGQAPSPPPEWRLFVAFPGSALIPAGLFIFAWTARPSVHWIVPIIGICCFGMGVVLIFMSAVMFVMDCYGPKYGASAMAANTLLRYVFGAAFPLFSRQSEFDQLSVGGFG